MLTYKSLNAEYIGTVLGTNATLVRYSKRWHVDDLDEKCQRTPATALVYMKDIPNRGRWAALSKNNGIYEPIDVYGAKPDKSLERVNLKMRRRLNQATPCWHNILKS